MKEKSIVKNALLNSVRNGLNVIFPLITFPYISRVLGVEKLGSYSFASSIISYFALLAGLGVSTYAIREGAKYRENRKKFEDFVDAVFTINVISTCVSYLCLFVVLCVLNRLKNHALLILILSIEMMLSTIGMEWIFSVYEEYEYITIKGIIFKIISVILIFVFVRSQNDLYIYACTAVFVSAGSSILNIANIKKFCSVRLTNITKCVTYIKPILILFTSAVASVIYVSSDTTMLGFMKGDYYVGIYTVSTKIYSIVKTILSSLIVVSVPRLSMYYGTKQHNKFKETVQGIYNTLMTILLPAVVGMFMISENIVLFVSGENYISASSSLRILSVALFFSITGWIFHSCIVLASGHDKVIMITSVCSAIANIILNYFLIPAWIENATALTTVISEIIVMAGCMSVGLKICPVKLVNNNTISACIGSIVIAIICLALKHVVSGNTAMFTIILCSTVAYSIVLMLLKNDLVNMVTVFVKTRLLKKEA